MERYIDVVSGCSALNHISNQIFDKKEQIAPSQYESFMILNKAFIRCYYDKSVVSSCGRRVIATSQIIKNITKTMKKFDKPNSNHSVYDLKQNIEAAFKGITDNCAYTDQTSYTPKKEK